MKYILTQTDGDDTIINKATFDVLDINSIVEEVYYCDIPEYKPLIKEWIITGAYKTESLDLYGTEVEEDGFITEAMSLTLCEC